MRVRQAERQSRRHMDRLRVRKNKHKTLDRRRRRQQRVIQQSKQVRTEMPLPTCIYMADRMWEVLTLSHGETVFTSNTTEFQTIFPP